MQRVLIVGPCGAGKSTLAVRLADRWQLPLHHMDRLNWQPGWVESTKQEIAARLTAIVATDRWVIDGTYGGTLDQRLTRADTVVYLDYPIRLCVWRLMRRIFTYRGRSRPDMTEGCPERFDAGFLLYLLRWNAGPRLRLQRSLAGYTGRMLRFRSPAALDQWLAAIKPA